MRGSPGGKTPGDIPPSDLPSVFIAVLEPELNPIPKCFVSNEAYDFDTYDG